MQSLYTDITVIGAGASGMTAAVSAAKIYSGKIALIEKLPRVGKKILSTGNGRCNLSNESISQDKYSGETRLLNTSDDNFITAELFFRELGLACRHDDQGRIYPHSMAASSVLDSLRFALVKAGVDTICDCAVSDIQKQKNSFVIFSDSYKITAKKLIIAAGGCASPSLGSDGSGYALARKLGHSVTALYPALSPLRTDVNAVKAIKGLRTAGKASLLINGRKDGEQYGEVQFSDGALSGICIFNFSAKAAEHIGNCEISLDIAPDYTKQELFEIIGTAKANRSDMPCDELLTGLFHKRIGQAVMKSVGDISFSATCGELSDKFLSKLCAAVKDWRFAVTGVSDWSLAQITSGGIKGEEIGDKLESKICKGLYFCGEIIDLQGQCGGYNLDWAWRSGYTAGKNAALSIITDEF